MKSVNLLIVAALVLFGSPAALAQTSTGNPSTRRLYLDVAVTDKKGNWIGGLKRENFKVFDQKVVREISSFTVDIPLSVGILIDVSGSSANRMGEIQAAASSFVSGCGKDTEYFLMTFSATRNLLQDRTEDRAQVMKAIDSLSSITPKSNTGFRDALSVGLDILSRGKHQKKALVIISDGFDNVSKRTFSELKREVRASDALLYNINTQTAQDKLAQMSIAAILAMEELAEISGGRVLEADPRLGDVAYRVAQDLRNQYRLGFDVVLRSDQAEDEWRKLEVKVELPANEQKLKSVNVRTRDGYLATRSGN